MSCKFAELDWICNELVLRSFYVKAHVCLFVCLSDDTSATLSQWIVTWLSQLNKIVTIEQNCHNWTKLSQLAKSEIFSHPDWHKVKALLYKQNKKYVPQSFRFDSKYYYEICHCYCLLLLLSNLVKFLKNTQMKLVIFRPELSNFFLFCGTH